jgi:hypothetical protein
MTRGSSPCVANAMAALLGKSGHSFAPTGCSLMTPERTLGLRKTRAAFSGDTLWAGARAQSEIAVASSPTSLFDYLTMLLARSSA